MRCGDHVLKAPELYRVYVRDLILVARCGDADARHQFLEQYAPQLEGLESQLTRSPLWEQEYAFMDAIRAFEEDGEPPHSLLGFRLALPKWFRGRVPSPFAVRRSAADAYRPDHLSVDPVCGMLVDPGQTAFRLLAGGEEVCFCCSSCLRAYRRSELLGGDTSA